MDTYNERHLPELDQDVKPGKSVSFEEVIAECGLGHFHVRMVLACGLGFAAAAVEVVLSGFLIVELRKVFTESEYRLSLLPTLVGLGSVVGEFAWGYAADRCGRSVVFTVTVVVVVVFGVLSAFSQGMASLICLRCVVGFGYGGNIAVDFAMFSEMLPKHRRAEMLTVVATFWPVGQVLTACIAWFTIPKYGWRTFLVVCAVPSFLTAFLRPLIPESPRWLLLHGYKDEALEVCRHIAELNGRSPEAVGLAPGARLVLSGEAQQLRAPDREKTPLWKPVLLGKGLWRTTLGCLLFCGLLNFAGYATTTFMPSFLQMKGLENMDMYKSMVISSVSQLPGMALAVWSMCYIGRLRPICMSLILLAISLMSFAVARSGGLLVLCSCLSSCFLELGWALCHVYVPEVFPTEVRAFAVGAISGVGSLVALVAPLLTACMLHFSSAGPTVAVFAAILALGSIAIHFLLHIETLDRDLTDTTH